MTTMERYTRDTERQLAAYRQEFWVDPDSETARWMLAHGEPKPGQVVPGLFGKDWGAVTHSSGFIPGHVGFPPQRWTCSYCGGLRGSEAMRCEGCGAART